MKWYIKDIEVKNQVVMAPMAGVSNPTYMSICEAMGVGMAVTELISSEAIIRGNKKTFEMLDGIEKLNIPVATLNAPCAYSVSFCAFRYSDKSIAPICVTAFVTASLFRIESSGKLLISVVIMW